MKKAAALLLVGILLLISLTACAAGGSAGQQAEQPTSVPEIGVSQQPETETDKDNQDVGVFDFDKKTVLLNSGYEMPILGLGTYSLDHDTLREFCDGASGKRRQAHRHGIYVRE